MDITTIFHLQEQVEIMKKIKDDIARQQEQFNKLAERLREVESEK